MVCFEIRSRGRANMHEGLNKLRTLWVSTYGGRQKNSGISAEENMSNDLQEEQNGILWEMEESSNSTREDESSGLVEMSELGSAHSTLYFTFSKQLEWDNKTVKLAVYNPHFFGILCMFRVQGTSPPSCTKAFAILYQTSVSVFRQVKAKVSLLNMLQSIFDYFYVYCRGNQHRRQMCHKFVS
jgi:hypothetical protein